jgi:hypothetical protein
VQSKGKGKQKADLNKVDQAKDKAEVAVRRRGNRKAVVEGKDKGADQADESSEGNPGEVCLLAVGRV